MGLLVAFFVMLVAFSTQDQAKLNIVAGSMREAFGMQDRIRYSGVIEVPGLPTRPKLKNTAMITPEDSSATPTPDEHGRTQSSGAKLDADGAFALATASLRQALQDMPDVAELSKHIMIEQSQAGLNIEIVDQDGRSMFPEGSKEPYERTRRLVQQLAGPLVVVWDNLNTHVSRAMGELIAARDWLTVYQLPPYAHELNPVEQVWSHLKRSLASLAKRNITELTTLVKTRLRRIQYRPGLLNGFLASTRLDLTSFCNPRH